MGMPRRSPSPRSQAAGRALRLIRRSREMTTTEVARRLGEAGFRCSHSLICNIEAGRRAVTVDELAMFAEVFGVAEPWALTRHTDCPTCHGAPPPGFFCRTCAKEEVISDAQ